MILFKTKKQIPFILISLISTFHIACDRPDKAMSNAKYEILEKDSLQSIILLKDTINKKQLDLIADSLFNLDHVSEENYRVWFYYRPDWKGHIYYAGKLWSYDIMKHDYIPPLIDITNIKSSDK